MIFYLTRNAWQLIFLTLFFSTNNQIYSQTSVAESIDSTIHASRQISINGKAHIGYLKPEGFYLCKTSGQIILMHGNDYYFDWAFLDLNKDGYNDILLDKGGNTPERFDLLLYIPATRKFKEVQDFSEFPSPVKIAGSPYYYSYHKSGCADMNWDSDLFYIKNFHAIRIGNISGHQCADTGIKDGIYIYKFSQGKKILKESRSIEEIDKFKEYKWGFIKEYWSTNFKQFQ